MLAIALSTTLMGLDAHPVRVEVEATRGAPYFELVGLAEVAVRESRVRVRSALAQVGIDLGECRIIVNLAPADVKKTGSGFDLAIAASALCALRGAPRESLEGVLFIGELSLDGTVHPARGVLPQLIGARSKGVKRAIVPRANEREAGLVTGIDTRTVASLQELVDALRGKIELPPAEAEALAMEHEFRDDLADVRGQQGARRALEIAAAGGHNLLMIGPPGAGKTMLARRLPSILPPLTNEEALEVTAIHSVAGLLTGVRSISRMRPFRAPHHTVSEVGLVGGGDLPRPGEVSLAHHGILFLDELAEFRRSAIESLRQPLEDGTVTISRAQAKATFPAQPLLVCAMNPCACGFLGDGTGRCGCAPERVRAYRSRLSGPVLDRIDIHVVLPPVDVAVLQANASGESSKTVRERVESARTLQHERWSTGRASSPRNASLTMKDLEAVAPLSDSGARLLAAAMSRLTLSARAYTKVLRVARTVADLDGGREVTPAHVAEAISLRVLDRGTSAAS